MRYALAIGLACAALLLRSVLTPQWGLAFPCSTSFAAIALSAWVGGLLPGVVTTGLTAAGVSYLWLPSTRGGHLPDMPDAVGLALFIATGVLISVAVENMQMARSAAETARDEAQRADRAKDEFLATIAHELRQPIHAVLPALELLQRQLSPDAFVHNHRVLDVLHRQMGHLRHLVDELLEASLVLQGRVTLNRRPISLDRAVRDAVDAVQASAAAREHALIVSVTGDAGDLHADPTRLHQVFSNVLSNAVKYTPRAGTIRVTARTNDDVVHISVHDTGCGIAASDLPHIFDLFTRIPGTGERGFGIGLAVTRQLVHLHGGTIEARSPGVGFGSEFVITLPIHASDLHRATREVAS